MLIGALSGESNSTSESILQKDAESRQIDEMIPQEFSLPSSDELIPEESSSN